MTILVLYAAVAVACVLVPAAVVIRLYELRQDRIRDYAVGAGLEQAEAMAVACTASMREMNAALRKACESLSGLFRMFALCPDCGGDGYDENMVWVGRVTVARTRRLLGLHPPPCPTCAGTGARLKRKDAR